MGGLADRETSSKSGHVNIKDEFQIAFAPVTNAEFAMFVFQGGYRSEGASEPPVWWDASHSAREFWRGRWSDKTWAEKSDTWKALSAQEFDFQCDYFRLSPPAKEAHLTRRAMSQADYEAEQDGMVAGVIPHEPKQWRNARFNNPLQPVVGVSLYEARAYVSWLNHLAAGDGFKYFLPTEAQWEAAARGTQGRLWPWGKPDPSDAQPRMNYSRDGCVGCTSPVAIWPDGATPEGVFDMAGQVCEWTLSSFEVGHGPIPSCMEVAADKDAERRAVRGGSWGDPLINCHAAMRDGIHSSGRGDTLGLRLLRCPIQSTEP